VRLPRALLLNAAVWTAAAFSAHALYEAALRPPFEPPAIDAPLAPAQAAEVRPVAPRPAAYAAIAERPLFAPSRRAPAQAEADASPLPPPAVALIGVVGRGEERLAMMRAEDGATLRLSPGQSVGGWVVARIDPRRVTLRRGEAEHVALLGAPPDADAAPLSSSGAPAGGSAPRRPAADPPEFDPFYAPESAFHDHD
jgi:hypothetical protein